jgi:proteic killer suppression protein
MPRPARFGKAARRTNSGDVAKSLHDLSPLKSVGLHKLKGARKQQWAMTANGPWRICFEFRKGDAYYVGIVDYHKG